jgi:hypothetical protein
VKEPIILKPDPSTPTIIGRDSTGLGWHVLDARNVSLKCKGCGGDIVYMGYVSADGRDRRCGGCVVREDGAP